MTWRSSDVVIASALEQRYFCRVQLPEGVQCCSISNFFRHLKSFYVWYGRHFCSLHFGKSSWKFWEGIEVVTKTSSIESPIFWAKKNLSSEPGNRNQRMWTYVRFTVYTCTHVNTAIWLYILIYLLSWYSLLHAVYKLQKSNIGAKVLCSNCQ